MDKGHTKGRTMTAAIAANMIRNTQNQAVRRRIWDAYVTKNDALYFAGRAATIRQTKLRRLGVSIRGNTIEVR